MKAYVYHPFKHNFFRSRLPELWLQKLSDTEVISHVTSIHIQIMNDLQAIKGYNVIAFSLPNSKRLL